MATKMAANVADAAGLPVATNVANLSQSLDAQNALAQSDANVVAKPQVVQAGTTRVIKQYTTVSGDTVPALAEKYGVSTQTIKWANNLTSDALEPGKQLSILPTNGVLYTVKDGDTLASVATLLSADPEQITLYNDLDLSQSLKPGVQLIIPNGTLPENQRPGYVAPTRANTNGVNSSYGGGISSANIFSQSAGNRYAYGNCTWYVYERRLQLGNPVGGLWGNANSWAYYARAAGYRVDQSPEVGSIMQNGGGYYGHVAIVEAVNPGVSVTISEMNAYRFGGGFNRIGRGDIPWSDAVSGYYNYIH